MLDLSELLKDTIPEYPVCPVERLCGRIHQLYPDDIDEEKIIEYINLIKKHEEELKTFRKGLERKLMEYMVESIVDSKEST